ncbi:hypothetical protein LSAT2_030865 [Lamellibrachia satsuma]|nr:hypothetical protein LSAT2_030865 [Lamellibrachia satsuma]
MQIRTGQCHVKLAYLRGSVTTLHCCWCSRGRRVVQNSHAYPATGYGTGAPTKACVDMVPEHRNTNPQTAISPYTLELEDGGAMTDAMRVCITGKSFRGILLQMRTVDGAVPVGTFDGAMLPNDTKLLKCSADGDSVTHENTAVKPNSTCFGWKIHDKKSTEKLNFVATIAESREKYWVKVTSDVINVSDGEAAPGNIGVLQTRGF